MDSNLNYLAYILAGSVCLIATAFFVGWLANKPSKASPRRLKGKSSSNVGTDGLPPMGDSDSGSDDCGSGGGD